MLYFGLGKKHNLSMHLRELGVDLDQEDEAKWFLGVTLEKKIKQD